MENLTSVKTTAEFSTSIVDGHNTMLPTIAAMLLKDWDSPDLADAVKIVHTALSFFVHSASDALPPYAVDIGLKWRHFAGDELWDSLSKLPPGVVRVLLWEIWKDFCTLKYGPHGWTVVYTPEGYQAQTSRLVQLSSNSARTGNLAGTSAMQAGNLGGGVADPGAGSMVPTVRSGEMVAAQDMSTSKSAENSGEKPTSLGVESTTPIRKLIEGVKSLDISDKTPEKTFDGSNDGVEEAAVAPEADEAEQNETSFMSDVVKGSLLPNEDKEPDEDISMISDKNGEDTEEDIAVLPTSAGALMRR